MFIVLILIGIISHLLGTYKTIDSVYNKNQYLEPKYMVCVPQGGIMDKCNVINNCIEYVKKYNRVLIIDTKRDWFNDDINEYIYIHSPYVYTGAADSIVNKINNLSKLPKNINLNNLDNIVLKKHGPTPQEWVYYKDDKSLTFDLNKDYNENVLVYSNCGGGFGFISLLEISTLAPNVLDVYKTRRAQLPEKYVGLHIRNTDIGSNISKFLDDHKDVLENNTIFLASDNKNTIDELKKIFGEKLVTFADIPDNGGKPIHEGYERTKEESQKYNIDTFVDILLLASADEYYFSCQKSGFSTTIKEMRTKPELIKRITA
jgi:hypothetical protein